MTDERDSNELLAERLKQRAAEGLAKYNKPLKPWDGRNTVVDAIEEMLDGAVYLTKLLTERADEADLIDRAANMIEWFEQFYPGEVAAYFDNGWRKVAADEMTTMWTRLTADIPRVGDAGYKSPSEPDRIQYHHTQRPAQERLDEMEAKPLPREEARKRFMPEPVDERLEDME